MKYIKQNVKVGNWEVCCNGMAGALIDDRIQASDDDGKLDLWIEDGEFIKFCPYCGKKIAVNELQVPMSTEDEARIILSSAYDAHRTKLDAAEDKVEEVGRYIEEQISFIRTFLKQNQKGKA